MLVGGDRKCNVCVCVCVGMGGNHNHKNHSNDAHCKHFGVAHAHMHGARPDARNDIPESVWSKNRSTTYNTNIKWMKMDRNNKQICVRLGNVKEKEIDSEHKSEER